MKFQSDDGKKVFDTQEECQKYEEELANKNNAKVALKKQIDEKVDEINTLLKEYKEKTGKMLMFESVNGLLRTIEIAERYNMPGFIENFLRANF